MLVLRGCRRSFRGGMGGRFEGGAGGRFERVLVVVLRGYGWSF